MAIPYNDNLALQKMGSTWHETQAVTLPRVQNPLVHAKKELYEQVRHQSLKRTEQCVRDVARLVLKVPIRAIATPIFLKANWRGRKCAAVNLKLAGYATAQAFSVPFKFIVALIALGIAKPLPDAAEWLLNESEEWTATLDGRASQLEALKEEGAKKAETLEQFIQYEKWLYSINPILCRKIKNE